MIKNRILNKTKGSTMKKLIIIFIIFTGLFYGQNRPRPGIDYLPHTGFFDFVVNALSHPWDGTTSTSLITEYNSKGWYLDSLKDLGLTNLVTDGQYHINHLQSLRHSFFLNDMGFQWKNINWTTPPIIFTPAEYLNSLGHDEKYYPLEFGGDIAGSIDKLNNFGFTTAGSNGTCYWGMQPNYQPAFDATGKNFNLKYIKKPHQLILQHWS